MVLRVIKVLPMEFVEYYVLLHLGKYHVTLNEAEGWKPIKWALVSHVDTMVSHAPLRERTGRVHKMNASPAAAHRHHYFNHFRALWHRLPSYFIACITGECESSSTVLHDHPVPLSFPIRQQLHHLIIIHLAQQDPSAVCR